MRTEHYFTPEPGSPRERHTLVVTLRGHELRLVSEAGVFSRARVDRGTRLLIAALAIGPDDRVLDLGCGYGVVGLVAARLAPQGQIALLDINARAVALAAENLRANGIGNALAMESDGYQAVAGERFDVIALNPPIRAGLPVVHRLIEQATDHLSSGGRFYLVARTRQGALRLREKIREVFGNVEEAAKGGGYRVFVSRRK
jgi:16S rRNA (guanine1207-N2)-methyltransferase